MGRGAGKGGREAAPWGKADKQRGLGFTSNSDADLPVSFSLEVNVCLLAFLVFLCVRVYARVTSPLLSGGGSTSSYLRAGDDDVPEAGAPSSGAECAGRWDESPAAPLQAGFSSALLSLSLSTR